MDTYYSEKRRHKSVHSGAPMSFSRSGKRVTAAGNNRVTYANKSLLKGEKFLLHKQYDGNKPVFGRVNIKQKQTNGSNNVSSTDVQRISLTPNAVGIIYNSRH